MPTSRNHYMGRTMPTGLEMRLVNKLQLVMPSLKRFALLIPLLFAAFTVSAQAPDPYPSKPLRFILPFPPGGPTDILGRLIGERFNLVTGTKLVHVPYKGVNLAMNDVLAGSIHLVVIGVPAAAPHIKSGRLRALAVIAPQRLPALPEVPTVAEAGLPDFEVTTWYGVLAPAGTPRPVVARLNGELVKILYSPDMKDKLSAIGTDPVTSTPEEFAAYLRQETAKWADVVRKAGLNAD